MGKREERGERTRSKKGEKRRREREEIREMREEGGKGRRKIERRGESVGGVRGGSKRVRMNHWLVSEGHSF